MSGDTWQHRLASYEGRARIRRGIVAVAAEDLRRLLHERQTALADNGRLEDQAEKARDEIYDREKVIARGLPKLMIEKEPAS